MASIGYRLLTAERDLCELLADTMGELRWEDRIQLLHDMDPPFETIKLIANSMESGADAEDLALGALRALEFAVFVKKNMPGCSRKRGRSSDDGNSGSGTSEAAEKLDEFIMGFINREDVLELLKFKKEPEMDLLLVILKREPRLYPILRIMLRDLGLRVDEDSGVVTDSDGTKRGSNGWEVVADRDDEEALWTDYGRGLMAAKSATSQIIADLELHGGDAVLVKNWRDIYGSFNGSLIHNCILLAGGAGESEEGEE